MTDTPVRRTPWPDSASRAVATPLQPSVVWASDDLDTLDAQYDGGVRGYTYAREGAPNADVLARKIDALEGLEGGFVLGSGMAAVTAALMGLCRAGDHVLGGRELYGRSMRMLGEELPRLGIDTDLVDTRDAAAVAAAIRPETRLILLEAVSNPGLRVADVPGVIAAAHDRGVLVAVDNTFTTPRALRPAGLGADIVVHSVTKLLAGHSDATLGYVAARERDITDRMRSFAVTLGLTPSPFDCWLAERGLYSFELRYDRAEENAARLADHLAGLDGVKRVLYPGRADHPDHERAAALLEGRFGNMVTFEIAGGRAAANRLVRAAPDIAFAPTLGDIGTTISNPATSSHRALTPEARAALGLGDGVFRVSVGVEPVGILTAELTAAIAASQKG